MISDSIARITQYRVECATCVARSVASMQSVRSKGLLMVPMVANPLTFKFLDKLYKIGYKRSRLTA